MYQFFTNFTVAKYTGLYWTQKLSNQKLFFFFKLKTPYKFMFDRNTYGLLSKWQFLATTALGIDRTFV